MAVSEEKRVLALREREKKEVCLLEAAGERVTER